MDTNAQNASMDIFDEIQNATAQARVFFGEIRIEAWPVVFVENQSTGKKEKVPFDPNSHRAADKRNNVKITVLCLPETGAKFDLSQETLDTDERWYKYSLGSIKALNLTVKQLIGKWVKADRVETSKEYSGRDGSKKKETAVVILAVYNTEQECREAYFAEGGAAPDLWRPAAAPVADDDGKKRAALAFLAPLWGKAAGDVDKFREILDKNPAVSQYYGFDSPEVQALIQGH